MQLNPPWQICFELLLRVDLLDNPFYIAKVGLRLRYIIGQLSDFDSNVVADTTALANIRDKVLQLNMCWSFIGSD